MRSKQFKFTEKTLEREQAFMQGRLKRESLYRLRESYLRKIEKKLISLGYCK